MPAEVKKEIQFEIGHVLFIDIVGYSKLLINEQSEQMQTLREIVRGTEQFRTAEAAGKLLRLPTGDGGALVFRTSLEAAVLCALEISKELKKHPELRARMGIHSGPVNEITDLNEQANIAGAGINIAQRVMDCGDGGHILVSRHVAEDLEHYPRWKPYLHELGEYEVKHGVHVGVVNLYNDEIGNPQIPKKLQTIKKRRARARWAAIAAAFLLIAGVIAAFVIVSKRSAGLASSVSEKSIAVLPFANLSRDPDNAYFAEGIQDEILTRLSKIADLKVISRTSTQQYESKPGNLSEIAKRLGVAHILEGSVQKSGDIVRVNVQLIKAINDSHLWADTFDRTLTDILSVESEVAKAIADRLRAKLTGQEEQVIAAKPTDNAEAYDAYLRGLAYSLKSTITPANMLEAQKYLREAVRLDPKFALSWALLSYIDATGYATGSLPTTDGLREEARQAADTALTLQPNLGEAILAKGHYNYACLKNYDAAEPYFEQARQLLPNNSRIRKLLAYVARRRGQWDRSEAYFNEAERLNPRDVDVLNQHAFSYIALRRFSEALRKLDQILDITPDDMDTIALKAGIAQAEGDLPRASALLAPLHPEPGDTLVVNTQLYQATLERRPAPIISRLKEILIKPDPALGWNNGALRSWLGFAQEATGDLTAARESWRQARSELEPFAKEQPGNFALVTNLAMVDAALGDKATASALAQSAIAAMPVEKDADFGPNLIEALARVEARTGERDRAIAALEQLLATPYAGFSAANVPLTPALLRLDPDFDSLRGDPRFQKLAASPAPESANK